MHTLQRPFKKSTFLSLLTLGLLAPSIQASQFSITNTQIAGLSIRAEFDGIQNGNLIDSPSNFNFFINGALSFSSSSLGFSISQAFSAPFSTPKFSIDGTQNSFQIQYAPLQFSWLEYVMTGPTF